MYLVKTVLQWTCSDVLQLRLGPTERAGWYGTATRRDFVEVEDRHIRIATFNLGYV